MRIAVVCGGPPIGGKEIMAFELGEGLRARGYSVEFVTSRWTDGEFKRRLDAVGLVSHQVWFGFISATLSPDCILMTAHQLVRWPQLLWGYCRFLNRFAPEKVLHTNWHSLLMILPLLRPSRDLFWLHDVIPDKPHYQRVFGWFARRIGCFITVSNAVAESLRRINIPENKIQVVHNGLSDPVPTESVHQEDMNGVRIGIVGRVGEWKGHDDLFEAFGLLNSECPNTELHVFGDGQPDYEERLKRRAVELGIAPKVIWHGFLTDRTQIYPNVEICAVPSRCCDSLPTVAIEAAFFGIPVVASRQGGLPEIVLDGETGYLCDVANPEQIASRLQDLSRDYALRQRMGMAARRRAQFHFSRTRFVGDFVHLLSN